MCIDVAAWHMCWGQRKNSAVSSCLLPWLRHGLSGFFSPHCAYHPSWQTYRDFSASTSHLPIRDLGLEIFCLVLGCWSGFLGSKLSFHTCAVNALPTEPSLRSINITNGQCQTSIIDRNLDYKITKQTQTVSMCFIFWFSSIMNNFWCMGKSFCISWYLWESYSYCLIILG